MRVKETLSSQTHKEGTKMKRSIINLTLATAALLVASTVASAADFTANIQFAFRAGGAVLQAGNYRLTASNAENGFQLRNMQTGESILLGAGVYRDPSKEWKGAQDGILQFTCGDRGCALRQVWTNSGYAAHVYSTPKPEDGMSARVALIRVVFH